MLQLSGMGKVSSLWMSAWLAFIWLTICAGVIRFGCRIPFWEFRIASIRILYSLLHSPKALSNGILCSLTASNIDVPENICLISLSCSLICLAISSKPLDSIFSFSDSANKVEFRDLRVILTTVTCSFEILENEALLFLFQTWDFFIVIRSIIIIHCAK